MKPYKTVERPVRESEALDREFVRTSGPGTLNDYGVAKADKVNEMRKAHPDHTTIALPCLPSCKTGK